MRHTLILNRCVDIEKKATVLTEDVHFCIFFISNYRQHTRGQVITVSKFQQQRRITHYKEYGDVTR